MIEISLENEGRCAWGRPSIIKSAEEPEIRASFPSVEVRRQTAAPSVVSSRPDAQNHLLLCLVPPTSHADMDLIPRFDRSRNLTPGLQPSSFAYCHEPASECSMSIPCAPWL
jgi:hypothetical protein